MKKLAGNEQADSTILEELYLANIPSKKVDKNNGEVPYSYIGKIENWTFKRAWYYWVVSVEDGEKGLPLNIALELHNKKNPTNDSILGDVIRSGGHCGCPSPDEYGAQPLYDEEYEKQLFALGYKKTYYESLDKEYFSITVGEVSNLCNEGKLTVKRYVDCYHIDTQIGLNEFVKTLNDYLSKKYE